MTTPSEAKWADELAGEKVLREAAEAALSELQEEFEQWKERPCGFCHPCIHWADETWRRAGRKPPTVSSYDETMRELRALRERP